MPMGGRRPPGDTPGNSESRDTMGASSGHGGAGYTPGLPIMASGRRTIEPVLSVDLDAVTRARYRPSVVESWKRQAMSPSGSEAGSILLLPSCSSSV